MSAISEPTNKIVMFWNFLIFYLKKLKQCIRKIKLI